METCELCRRPSAKLVLDHDHHTGLDRGYLCPSCNAGLGLFGDSPDRLRMAIAYLEKTTHEVVPRVARRPSIVFTPRDVLSLMRQS